MYRNALHRLILAGIVGATAQFLIPSVSAGTPVTPPVLRAPLPPDHPNARLDPALLDLPAIQPPAPRSGAAFTLTSAAASQGVSYNLHTRQTQLEPIVAPKRRGGGTEASFEGVAVSPAVGGPLFRMPEVVIGTDQRRRVNTTTTFPWRTQCKLFLTFPDGGQFIGSGTLIQGKYVLTAGHCVYSADNGGFATAISVAPGLNGSSTPYGTVAAMFLRTYTGWTQDQNPGHDFGLVTLASTIGQTTGWMGYANYSPPKGLPATITGYPGDLAGGLGLYTHSDTIKKNTALQVQYAIDTAGGQSGSGVYRKKGSSYFVYGVHAYGGATLNAGTRIDAGKFASIKGWIQTGQ